MVEKGKRRSIFGIRILSKKYSDSPLLERGIIWVMKFYICVMIFGIIWAIICDRDILLIGGRLVASDWLASDLQFLAATKDDSEKRHICLICS